MAGKNGPAWAKGVKVQKKKPSALKRGIAALGIIGNVYGAGTTLPQSGTVPLNDEGESSVRGERDCSFLPSIASAVDFLLWGGSLLLLRFPRHPEATSKLGRGLFAYFGEPDCRERCHHHVDGSASRA